MPLFQLLVLGGNGFVGSHVCREALGHGLTVSSLSRYCFFICCQQKFDVTDLSNFSSP